MAKMTTSQRRALSLVPREKHLLGARAGSIPHIAYYFYNILRKLKELSFAKIATGIGIR